LDFFKPITDAEVVIVLANASSVASKVCFSFQMQHEDTSLESRFLLSLLLEPNSLLVLKDDMYQKYLHGIDQRAEDIVSDKICNLSHLGTPVSCGDVLKRTTRVSLTIRHVPKVLRVKLKLGK